MYNTHFFTLRNDLVEGYVYYTLEHDQYYFFLNNNLITGISKDESLLPNFETKFECFQNI